MRHAIPTLALAAMVASPLAFAGPHGGGAMGGGMGGGARPMASPARASPATASSGPQRAATSSNTSNPSSNTSNNGVSRQGQPNQSCQSAANYPADTPGNSFNAGGSAFNPNGVADAKYAGTQPQNSNNPKSVAQYDVACSNQK